MRVLKAQQIRDWDKFTIKFEPISSLDLMERAASRWTKRFVSQVKPGPVTLVCGIGNNGGDGLVIGRLLHQRGYDIDLQIIEFSDSYSDDFRANLKRLHSVGVEPKLRNPEDGLPLPKEDAVVVDAIFGSGLNRPVEGDLKACIEQINSWRNYVISVDMPSGMMADGNHENDKEAIVEADQTWTFQCVKVAFLMPDVGEKCGEWEVIPIGLHPGFPGLNEEVGQVISLGLMNQKRKKRQVFSHKGTFGHATIIAGSEGMMGSAAMATMAALRSGCGLVTAHVPSCGVTILQSLAPEAMVKKNLGEYHLKQDETTFSEVLGIGPGIGNHSETKLALMHWLDQNQSMVLDADALNMIAADKKLLDLIPQGSIITPHPKEFERLTGTATNRLSQVEMARQLAKDLRVVVVLKGRYTAICDPKGKVWFNPTGNTALAKGGSGDVLTGLITGLLAQGYSSADAAIIGVYVHGRAAQALVRTKPAESCTAIDLIHFLWQGGE